MREFSLLNVPTMKISFQYWEWNQCKGMSRRQEDSERVSRMN